MIELDPDPAHDLVCVAATETHPLRLAVLRTGTSSRDPVYPGDELATTRHVAIRDGDRLVAVSTWIVEPFPPEPARPGLHLRGMATVPERRGEGLGAALLDAGRARAEELGAEIVWARARVTAVSFYEAHGFAVAGDEFIDETSGLPHVLVHRRP